MDVQTNHVTEATIEATVIRANGRIEHLGVLDSYRRPWWRTLLQKVTPWRQ